MDFTRKAQFFAGKNTIESSASVTYLSVVLRHIFYIGFLIVMLNGVDLMSCDLYNTYLNKPVSRRYFLKLVQNVAKIKVIIYCCKRIICPTLFSITM